MINHLHQIALGILFVSYGTYGHSSYNTDGGSCYEQVATCPCSKDLWTKKSQNTTCPQLKRYACVLHADGILVEICTANFTIPFGRTGCPYVKSCNDKGEAEFGMPSKYEKCPESITGCPNQSHPEYSIYEMYLYPACFITDRTVLKNQSYVTSCTKKERMNTPETPSKMKDILFFMILIVSVLIVIVIVILHAVCCGRIRRWKGFDEDEEDQSQTLQQPEEENSSGEDITNGTDQNQIGEMNCTKNERPHTPQTPFGRQNNLLIRMFISAIVRFSLQVYRLCCSGEDITNGTDQNRIGEMNCTKNERPHTPQTPFFGRQNNLLIRMFISAIVRFLQVYRICCYYLEREIFKDMASASVSIRLCEQCKEDGKDIKAITQCYECHKILFEPCSKYHLRSKISKLHHPIEIAQFMTKSTSKYDPSTSKQISTSVNEDEMASDFLGTVTLTEDTVERVRGLTCFTPKRLEGSGEDITNGTDQNQIGEMNCTKNERPHTPETPSVGQDNLLIRMFISAIVIFSPQIYIICNAQFQEQDYRFWRADRNTHDGGIIVYKRSGIACDRKKELEFQNIESIDVCNPWNFWYFCDVDPTFTKSSNLNVCFDLWTNEKYRPCKVLLEMALQIKIEDVCSEVRHDDIQYPELNKTKPVLRPLQTKTLM